MSVSDSEVEHRLRRMSNDWVSALKERNTDALERIMAPDCTFTYPLEGDGTEQFVADIRSGELIVEELTRDNVEVRVFGQTAVLTGLDTAKWLYKGHVIEGYYKSLHVYAERKGLWQLVAIQACPIAQ
jgi:ketosteroid isomerase-like protein